MPLITFICNNPECENKKEHFYAKRKDVPSFLDCFCGGKMERTLGISSTSSKFTVDNGLQPKSVELTEGIYNKEVE
jgi:hypothetical protein